MIITIKTGDYRGYTEFSVAGVLYDVDSNNIPVDIVVYGNEETLQAIAEFACGEGNLRELEEYYPIEKQMADLGATHACLYARMNEFKVREAE